LAGIIVKLMRHQAIALFRATFGAPPRAAASAPGRVNLIGEHTDYNGGPVLPIAIGARTTAAVGPGTPELLEAVSASDGRVVRVRWRDEMPRGWGAYLVGVLRELWAHEVLPPGGGARVAIAGDVPIGAGLSSSAALTVAAARALELLADAPLDPRQTAGIAYRAEHDHAGIRCGVMDQTIAALGKPGHALLIECASLVTRQVPFRGHLLVVDTGVRHDLAASAYNDRVEECRAALERLKVDLPELLWLAAWPATWVGRLKRALPQPLRNRALHVVGETTRTRYGAQLLQRRQLARFGRLLYESHESCRRLYECSSPELDLVVAAARRAGALGARMTGAGWGGSVVVLVRGASDAARVSAAVQGAFRRKLGRDPAIYRVKAAGGARREGVR
jgi:galactokinase